ARLGGQACHYSPRSRRSPTVRENRPSGLYSTPSPCPLAPVSDRARKPTVRSPSSLVRILQIALCLNP
ncbi:MAG TPA: hypothetical protein PK763_09210, partial [Anaerolineaceae bacterium]|nr:hypothetical protein [Anaerolineaceae bacterium]